MKAIPMISHARLFCIRFGCVGLAILLIGFSGCSSEKKTVASAERTEQPSAEQEPQAAEAVQVQPKSMQNASDTWPDIEPPQAIKMRRPDEAPAGSGFPKPMMAPAEIQSMAPQASQAQSSRARALAPQAFSMESAEMAAPPKAAAIQNPPVAMQETLEPPMASMPAGSEAGNGFATVQVFYATDRQLADFSLADIDVKGKKQWLLTSAVGGLVFVVLALVAWTTGRSKVAVMTVGVGGVAFALAAFLVFSGEANIEKHGVTYSGERGKLVQGVCEVTVPNSHERGMVERPSLLRFEFTENQQEHLVLTSAVELSEGDFQQRLSQTVQQSPQKDLLVFIHGFNVDFQSAVRRTAQIAVDLPFEGVPVCYSWPSQGTLWGYPVDENNVEWSVVHLKQFLQDLAQKSGADSINVVAHSMGNRAMTAAMQQIRFELGPNDPAPFDRVVLAAPDVDADRFRRDFAPVLLDVAEQVTLYASSDDQALVASKQVHGYPRAGESGTEIVVVPGVETIDVSGIDLSLLGHSYYGDSESILRDLYQIVRDGLPASQRTALVARQLGANTYWELAHRPISTVPPPTPARR
ncbi:MraY-like glycosyltransferase [Roseimaritima multifibrata]|uniref:MraY-like glycosyltransferase n=1 Tax=Roseimaritima multifibrata TaxID=1930274 RepID=A0A517MF28_9BACT|nr:alpha/beta hydrolase [Roseimaritima multifibrata]QDS93491.1 MraY-like glycosyltransferase [Roseimaritima multifibrata]